MINAILTSDLHLTDNPLEAYRWDIFPYLSKIAKENNATHIFILGDITDRADKHSSKLLNRIVNDLAIVNDETNASIVILMGNHDAGIGDIPYWTFLNDMEYKIVYVTTPVMYQDIYLLPYAHKPIEEWKDLPLASAKCIFMHQTINNSLAERDRKLTGSPMPKMPNIPIYSGDVHRPQEIDGVVYVGAPYPVRFSETWSTRVLLISSNDYGKYKVIPINIMNRAILEIGKADQLYQAKKFVTGDQVKIRYNLSSKEIADWPLQQEEIKEWAKNTGVTLVSLEAVFKDDIPSPEQTAEKATNFELLKPEEIIRIFGEEEKLSQEVMDCGIELLKGIEK